MTWVVLCDALDRAGHWADVMLLAAVLIPMAIADQVLRRRWSR